MAPRRELQQPFQHDKAFIGQTLRYKYETVQYAVCVLARYSKSIRALVTCGPHSGEIQSFELIEVSNCYELFGSALLQNLFTQTKEAEWSDAKKSRTRQIPVRKPKLNPEFEVPQAEQNKRLVHFFKLLGSGVKLLSKSTNLLAKRRFSRGNSNA